MAVAVEVGMTKEGTAEDMGEGRGVREVTLSEVNRVNNRPSFH